MRLMSVGDEQKPEPEYDRRSAITRHLVPGRSVETELELYASLPHEKQAIVDRRLAVVDAYLSGPRSMSDAQTAANALGIGIRNLYRLVTRMAEVGPVGAMAPGHRHKQIASTRREGFEEHIELWLREFLRVEPDARVSKVEAFLSGAIQAHNGSSAEKLEVPSLSSIRARVQNLRRSGVIGRRDRFGEVLLIDQVDLNVAITDLSEFNRGSPATATFVLDQGTSLIAGVGLTTGDGIGLGLEGALWNAVRTRIPAMVAAGLRPGRLRRLEWSVPAGLDDVYGTVSAAAAAMENGPRIVTHADGARRHGASVAKLLGDGLGALRFQPRASASGKRSHRPEASLDRSASTQGLRLDEVYRILNWAADEWNRKRLAQLPGPSATDGEGSDEVAELFTTLRTIFRPLFEAINDRFVVDWMDPKPRPPVVLF